jgi:hypothetical protein
MQMLRVVIQDENGREVSQGIDVPTDVLSRPNDHRFSCLRFVDAYGDTIFNRLQLGPLLEDVGLLKGTYQSTEHEVALRRIESLIGQCQAKPHLYLKLIGD